MHTNAVCSRFINVAMPTNRLFIIIVIVVVIRSSIVVRLVTAGWFLADAVGSTNGTGHCAHTTKDLRIR